MKNRSTDLGGEVPEFAAQILHPCTTSMELPAFQKNRKNMVHSNPMGKGGHSTKEELPDFSGAVGMSSASAASKLIESAEETERRLKSRPISKLRRSWKLEDDTDFMAKPVSIPNSGGVLWSKLKRRVTNRRYSRTKLLEEEKGVPIRETLQSLYILRRQKFLRYGFLLVLSLISLVSMISLTIDSQEAFEQEESVRELFVDEEFQSANHKKNFFDVRSQDEIWEWIEGPLLQALYKNYDITGNLKRRDWLDYTAQTLRVVGGVELRQLRMRNDSCTLRRRVEHGTRYDTKAKVCYNRWTNNKGVEKRPFGPRGIFKYTEGLSRIYGRPGSGKGPWVQYAYGTGGYVQRLPLQSLLHPFSKSTNTTAENILNNLKSRRWLDESSRLVAVEFALFNTMTELLSACLFTFEILPSGYVQPYALIRTLNPVLVDFDGGRFKPLLRLFFEISVFLLTMLLFVREARRLARTRPISRYISWENVIEVIHMSCQFWFFFVWYISVVGDEKLRNFDASSQKFVSYIEVAENMYLCWQIAAFVMIISSVKLFKFLSLSRRMSVLWLSLDVALGDIAAFGFALMIIIMGFAFSGQYVYGAHDEEFNTFGKSCVTMFRGLIGDIDVDRIQSVAPIFTVILYVVWSLLTKVIALNMFIAIVTRAFDHVSDDSQGERWKYDLPSPIFILYKSWMVTKYRCARKRYLCCKSKRFVEEHTRKSIRQNDASFRKRTVFVRGEDQSGFCGCLKDCLRGKFGFLHAEMSSEVSHFMAEADFLDALRNASRNAERKPMVTDVKNLFSYFKTAYHETRTVRNGVTRTIASFMHIDELCSVTLPRSQGTLGSCMHVSCPAADIVDAYNRFKSVIVMHGESRKSNVINKLRQEDMMEMCFDVLKVNNMGRKQSRILIIDRVRNEMRTFDSRMRLHAILPLNKLHQIETSENDVCRLQLTFEEGIYSFCTLLFRNQVDMQRFVGYLVEQNEMGMLTDSGYDVPVSTEGVLQKLASLEEMQLDIATILAITAKSDSRLNSLRSVMKKDDAVSESSKRLAKKLEEKLKKGQRTRILGRQIKKDGFKAVAKEVIRRSQKLKDTLNHNH